MEQAVPAEAVAQVLAQKIASLEYELAIKTVAIEQLQQALALKNSTPE